MLKPLRDYLTDIHDLQRIAIALARGAAARQARCIDLRHPGTWEFSGFSQNGEDGLIEVLRTQLKSSNRCFVEVGAANGVQNNSTWLAMTQGYHGVMVEGNPEFSAKAKRLLSTDAIGVRFVSRFVTRENAAELGALCGGVDPDLFSLDIDGNDYHVAGALLGASFRPRIVVVEYNSVFGPERSVTVPYRPDFDASDAHPSRLYYGVSLSAWRRLFEGAGYRFVTVDRNGVNAVFVDPAHFDQAFLHGVMPLQWAENAYQVMASGRRGEAQFELISSLALQSV
jgi:hypothetical protein